MMETLVTKKVSIVLCPEIEVWRQKEIWRQKIEY